MKKLILILITSIFLLGVISLNAQTETRPSAMYNSALVGTTPDTTVTTAATYAPSSAITISRTTGLVAFGFEFLAGITDTLATATLWGSLNNSDFVSVTSQTLLAAGSYFIKDDSPDYVYYKLILTPQSGDSIFVNNVNFLYKEE